MSWVVQLNQINLPLTENPGVMRRQGGVHAGGDVWYTNYSTDHHISVLQCANWYIIKICPFASIELLHWY